MDTSPPRRARRATPLPTVPPPLDTTPEPIADRVKKRIELGHVLIGAAVLLMGGGFAFASWQGSFATKADVAQVAAPLDVLDTEVQVLKARAATVESALDGPYGIRAELALIREQLVEIAIKTGARQVLPAPTPPTQGAPP